MSYRPIRWVAIAAGDSLRLRLKRVPGPRVEATVAQLLDRTLADGLGFVDEAGEVFRQYFYDIGIFTSPAPYLEACLRSVSCQWCPEGHRDCDAERP